MKTFISWTVSFFLLAILFLPRVMDLPYPQRLLLRSLLPICAIIWGYNQVRFSFREIKGQWFRLTVYGLSLLPFAICALSCARVISLTNIHIAGGISAQRRAALVALVVSIAILTVFNLYFALRDGSRRERDLPL